jgi:hypothetical protein
MKWYRPASEWGRVAALAIVVPLLGACTSSLRLSQLSTPNSHGSFRVAGQRAIECRAAVAWNPHYQMLR